jgi:hypothetical protein
VGETVDNATFHRGGRIAQLIEEAFLSVSLPTTLFTGSIGGLKSVGLL